MFQFTTRRSWMLVGVAILWLVAAVIIVAPWARQDVVVVTHWANGHMTSASLLPTFASQFNAGNRTVGSGKRIEVRPVTANSGAIACQLIRRANANAGCAENEGTGGGDADNFVDPTIVTPAADHWLTEVNHVVGRDVVDTASMRSLAKTWIGIATLREMAQCLGWPNREIGFADIIALRNDPRGWASCPTSKAEWGQTPLLSFTDPDTSSTGRSMLFTLYAIAAGKPPAELTGADVVDPKINDYVKQFQRGVDHYVPDTLILNSKIYLGPRYSHFFLIAEDNLVKLYQGKVDVEDIDGKSKRGLQRDMVFIYPKEGSPAHNHSAAIVKADWVTDEQAEAAQLWVDFLFEDVQQQAFMQEGFRPGTNVAYTRPENSRFWPDPSKPTTVIDPDRIDPTAAQAINAAWDSVKKPGVVTFLIDTSGSMAGEKMKQAQEGTVLMVDKIDLQTQVGLLTFSDAISDRVPVGSVEQNKYAIQNAAKRMRPAGNTNLYSALQEAIRMTDEAVADPDATRGVVVLTDGKANSGVPLHSIIRMMSRDEKAIRTCAGFDQPGPCIDEHSGNVERRDVLGLDLVTQTRHPIHIFYVGIGKDADLEVGRIMAEATHSAYQSTTEKTLKSVMELFGKYF